MLPDEKREDANTSNNLQFVTAERRGCEHFVPSTVIVQYYVFLFMPWSTGHLPLTLILGKEGVLQTQMEEARTVQMHRNPINKHE